MKREPLVARGDDPGADYIRLRLKRRVELERGITMRGAQVNGLLRCLDRTASLSRIEALHAQAISETSSAVWGLEMEALLREFHGDWRYDGKREILLRDLAAAARFYAVAMAMDELLRECGFPVVRTREERLDDAAWWALPKSERS